MAKHITSADEITDRDAWNAGIDAQCAHNAQHMNDTEALAAAFSAMRTGSGLCPTARDHRNRAVA